MTLIENLAWSAWSVKDYEFHARQQFCQPSERTLALAEKVLKRLKSELADDEDDEWIAFCESGGYEECNAGLDEWED